MVVEDDPIDFQNLMRALEACKVRNPLLHFRDANSALRHLQQMEAGSRPALVILDLYLTGPGGLEFLQQLRVHAAFASLPVFVFTASEREEDIRAAHAARVAAYMVKPLEYAALLQQVTALSRFWSLTQFAS